ncbi:MarR family transcriptional regulator [Streptomyces sp. A7024]|uniref:MarR family transcriptional regulator n=1 Tax=Streptomyces coryli TaxID=1128680 RepID=A0A6G4U4E9_9ACTN|nr:MarR family transcriptional regulator [Streptomyces coryli]
MGWPRMAGRAAGLLMLSEQPLTLTELQEALGASKGSVSEMTRLLIEQGTVERYKPEGRRHFVYRWREDAWAGCLQHLVAATTQLRGLAERAEAQDAGLSAVQRRRLREMREYYRFMVRHLEALLTEYADSLGTAPGAASGTPSPPSARASSPGPVRTADTARG